MGNRTQTGTPEITDAAKAKRVVLYTAHVYSYETSPESS